MSWELICAVLSDTSTKGDILGEKDWVGRCRCPRESQWGEINTALVRLSADSRAKEHERANFKVSVIIGNELHELRGALAMPAKDNNKDRAILETTSQLKPLIRHSIRELVLLYSGHRLTRNLFLAEGAIKSNNSSY